MKLRLLAVSDVVNPKLYSPQVLELKDKVDLIVSCGDVPIYYLDFIATTLGKPLFFVCGNHDNYDIKEKGRVLNQVVYPPMNSLFEKENIKMGGVNLDGRIENYMGFTFAGLEGSMEYNKGEHQYRENEMRRKIFRLIPGLILNRIFRGRYLDVLVTHSPPFGVHDRNDKAHKGFKSFLNFIKRFSPAYLIHGHSHIYDNREERITMVGKTKVINCYDYMIIEVEK
ncbi:MAG: metallophosphoesterase family protein [Brevinematia bacterium]